MPLAFDFRQARGLKSLSERAADPLQKAEASRGEHRIIARSYLDTLDWRLLKSGYLLIAEPRDDFVGLQLRSLTRNDLLSQARADSLPQDLSSFPLGKIRDLIAPVMDVRALVEQVRSRVEQQVFHKTDDDGKTLVSAFLERSVTKHPVVSREPLCRLTINALKGYESDADKVVKRITRNGDFIASDETDLEKLIHSASIDINRFKSKPEINLARGDRSDSAIKKMLLDLLDLIEINRQPILEDVDVECLHDYRVSVRTTRVILKQLPDVFPKATVDRFSAGFKKLGDLTSELRDLDVMLLEFDQYSSMAPKGHRNHLESVREFLATRRLDLFNGLSRYLNSASYRNFVGRWRSFLLKPCPANTRIRNARRPIEGLLTERTLRSHQRVLRRGAKITHQTEPEALHELRKDCKKLRYVIEFGESLHTKKEINRAIKIVKGLQNVLGEYQDLFAHVALFESTKRQMFDAGILDAKTAKAIDKIIARLTSSQKEVRRQFNDQYARFASNANQQLFTELFRT